MEQVERKGADMGEGGMMKTLDPPPKIALVPFVQGDDPRVHLLDGDGKASSARDRSVEDDFQLAVQNLGVGHADEDGSQEDVGGEDREPADAGVAHEKEGIERDGSGAAGSKAGGGRAVGSEAATSGATQEAVSPPEHPLQKAITSFDMALGELNQLVHLVDLARAGEFVVLERVTPTEEDQARAISDRSAKPGDGVPREALPTMVNLKKNQLKGVAKQLRERARRLRETTKAQRIFQQGVVHLRKSWRIVAPNHGKVNMPLQVGEALSVDCSFGSAGGQSVPFTAAAGTRHRHPWLFQLSCGEGGRLKAQPPDTQCLRAFEVQLVSVVTGECVHSVRASFPERSDCDRTGNDEQLLKPPSLSNGERVPKVEGWSETQMDQLEQHISRLQHGVFWEEVFETLKVEALHDGKDGWMARQDARGGDGVVTPETVGRIAEGTKRRLVCLNPQETKAARNAGARVAHILDDEVMVEMDSHFLLGYRLVSGEREPRDSSGGCSTSALSAEDSTFTKDRSWGPGWRQSASLCQLALLYCGSLVRQQQRDEVVAGQGSDSNKDNGREVGAWIPSGSTGGRARKGTTGGHLSAACTWKSVRRVCLHHIFRSEVVQRLAHVSRTLQKIGLPFVVRWTHLEETCPASALTFTLGHCFHFRASLDGGFGVVVSALPGLQNHADQRSVELQSAEDLQHFLLGEVCRQIVLTFGDITAAWTSGKQPEGTSCFRVELVPAAIHLLPRPKSKTSCDTSMQNDGGSCEVRVFVEGVGVRIACSSFTTSSSTSNGRGPANQDQAGVSEASVAWHSDVSRTVTVAPVNMAEWDRLEGRDLFLKFSSLLALRYPL
ncbi:unnamed protein product [Pylaiella littoralis]